jgi:hypothetical protein
MAQPGETTIKKGPVPSAHDPGTAGSNGRARPSRPFLLIALELLIGVGAVYGGVGLMWNNAIGMPDEWLQGTPFTSWVLPGVFLLLVVAVPMTAAAVLEVRHSARAAVASVLAGAAEVGWIAAELFVMQKYNVLQPVMLALGLAVMLLALWAHRAVPLLARARR